MSLVGLDYSRACTQHTHRAMVSCSYVIERVHYELTLYTALFLACFWLCLAGSQSTMLTYRGQRCMCGATKTLQYLGIQTSTVTCKAASPIIHLCFGKMAPMCYIRMWDTPTLIINSIMLSTAFLNTLYWYPKRIVVFFRSACSTLLYAFTLSYI